MGRKNTVRKERVVEVNDEHEHENESDSEVGHIKQQIEDEYLFETVLELQKALIDFTNDGGYPLCEFLDIQNVENFVNYLLR